MSAAKSGTTGALFHPTFRFAQCGLQLEPTLVTRQRQHATLADVARSLTAALDLANERAGEELVAEQLRPVATGLVKLTGRGGRGRILDAIFREFCVGK